MSKTKLSTFQLYAMVVLYCLGTSSILFVAREARQDAWISIILGGIASLIIFVYLHGSIFKLNQEDNSYYDTIQKVFGKPIGKAVILLYAFYFIFITFFVLRDIVEITELYILNRTPRYVITIVEICVIIYGLHRGIETLFRTAELYLFIVIFCYLLVILLLPLSGVVNFDHLFPVLEKGIGPVLQSTPVLFLSIPFGELIVFLAFFPLVKDKRFGVKAGAFGLLTVILIMLLITIFLITTLGPYLAYNNTFPVVIMIRLIDVGDFIQRFDALMILIFLTGSVFQILVLVKVAEESLKVVTNFPYKSVISIFIGILLYFGAYFVGESRRDYLYLGIKIFPYFISSIFEIGLPIIILILSIYHHIKGNKAQKNAAPEDAAPKTTG